MPGGGAASEPVKASWGLGVMFGLVAAEEVDGELFRLS